MAKFANILEVEKIRINIFETEPINGLAAPDGRIFIGNFDDDNYKNLDWGTDESGEVKAAIIYYDISKFNETC